MANSNDPYGVIDSITKVAEADHIDPNLAIAIARQESGLDPYRVGDQGTSFGLFQLHKGGELPAAWAAGPYVAGHGGSIPIKATDPTANAQVALSVVQSVQNAHPTWSPGQIAAAAQRPADQPGYARSINSMIGGSSNYNALANTSAPTAQTAGLEQLVPGLSGVTDTLSFFKELFKPENIIRVAEAVAGFTILTVGVGMISFVLIQQATPEPLKKAAKAGANLGLAAALPEAAGAKGLVGGVKKAQTAKAKTRSAGESEARSERASQRRRSERAELDTYRRRQATRATRAHNRRVKPKAHA